jgi:hypothetical protein
MLQTKKTTTARHFRIRLRHEEEEEEDDPAHHLEQGCETVVQRREVGCTLGVVWDSSPRPNRWRESQVQQSTGNCCGHFHCGILHTKFHFKFHFFVHPTRPTITPMVRRMLVHVANFVVADAETTVASNVDIIQLGSFAKRVKNFFLACCCCCC